MKHPKPDQVEFVYSDGNKLSTSIFDFKDKPVTFNTDFLNKETFYTALLKSPFKELSLLKSTDLLSAEDKESVGGVFIETVDTPKMFAKRLKKVIASILVNEFDESKQYLFLHSKGYDSRVLSAIMRQLHESGIKDFSNVHFRCHPPECEEFLRSMKVQGWHSSQYSCYVHEKGNHFRLNSNVPINGWLPFYYQINYWHDIPNWQNMTVMGGFHVQWLYRMFKNYTRVSYKADERLDGLSKESLQHYLYCHYHQFKDYFMPYFYYSFVRAMRYYNRRFYELKSDVIREAILKSCNRKLLGYNVKNARNYDWGISEKVRKEMIDRFYGSKFYDKYKKLLPDKIDFFYDPDRVFYWEACLWGFACACYDEFNDIGG